MKRTTPQRAAERARKRAVAVRMEHPREQREPCPDCMRALGCTRKRCMKPELCPCRTMVCPMCRSSIARARWAAQHTLDEGVEEQLEMKL